MVPADSEKGFVADRTSTLVGMARLRQLRILNGEASFTCPVALSLSLSVHLSTAVADPGGVRGVLTPPIRPDAYNSENEILTSTGSYITF